MLILGYNEIKTRSRLALIEYYVTVLKCGKPVYTPWFAYGVLQRFLPEEKVESIKGLSFAADGKGVVFDVAVAGLHSILAGQDNAARVNLRVVTIARKGTKRRFGGGGRFGWEEKVE